MAMNPMQRRTRNSFLLGFLIALVIMFLVVLFLLYKNKTLNEQKEALEALQSKKYVTTQALASGTELTAENFSEYFKTETVISDVPSSEIFSEEDFDFIDEVEGTVYEKIDEEGNKIYKKMQMRISVPAGAIVTKNMVEEIDNPTTADQRIEEYTSILLPTQLEEGQYIDIRYSIPDGQDYIVLSRKKVLQCNATSIWLKMTEDEILTMNSAIVESYRNEGIKLYAIVYVEPGMQTAAIPTYPVKEEVKELIRRDPNVLQAAKDAIEERYARLQQNFERNDHISRYLTDTLEEQASSVSAGNAKDASVKVQERQNFLNE